MADADLAAQNEMLSLQIEEAFDQLAQMNSALRADEAGWQALNGYGKDDDFTPEARRQSAQLARMFAIANPLIKNGLAIRAGYIWGQGVEIVVKDDPDQGQDVNAVVSAFLGDPDNIETWSSGQAREEAERALGTDGELFWAFPTNLLTGRVKVAEINPDEIEDIVEDPGNWKRPLLYKRVFVPLSRDENGKPKIGKPQTEYYPALGYQPRVRPVRINGDPVVWDTPVLHVAVNRPRRSMRGIGDAYASLPWAAMSKQWMENWHTMMKALTRLVWQQTTTGSRVSRVAKEHRANSDGAGGVVVSSPDSKIEAIPKSGATIDADSGMPLIKFVAAGLGVPYTMLLGDPGATGARAVAETLDAPTENGFRLRRELWGSKIKQVLEYVIDMAVIAPGGPLRGTIRRDGDRQYAELPDGDARTIELHWPEFDSSSVLDAIRAVQVADQLDKLDPLTVARLALQALRVRNVDDVINLITDDQGNYVSNDERASAGRDYRQDRGDT